MAYRGPDDEAPVQFFEPVPITNARCCGDPYLQCPRCAARALAILNGSGPRGSDPPVDHRLAPARPSWILNAIWDADDPDSAPLPLGPTVAQLAADADARAREVAREKARQAEQDRQSRLTARQREQEKVQARRRDEAARAQEQDRRRVETASRVEDMLVAPSWSL